MCSVARGAFIARKTREEWEIWPTDCAEEDCWAASAPAAEYDDEGWNAALDALEKDATALPVLRADDFPPLPRGPVPLVRETPKWIEDSSSRWVLLNEDRVREEDWVVLGQDSA